MTDEERAKLKLLVDEMVKLMWALKNHPDLPQHGDTRTILLAMIERLGHLNQLAKQKSVIVSQ